MALSGINITAPNGGEYWSGEQDITWGADCGTGDTVNIYYSTDGFLNSSVKIDDHIPCSSYSYLWNTASVSDGNNYQIKVRDTDDIDVYDTSGVFTVDNTDPITSDDVLAGWQTSNVTVTFTCDDSTGGNSGCSKVYYTTDNSDPTTSSSFVNVDSSWQFTMLTNGEYTIKYRGEDVAGNLEAINTAGNILQLDKINPATIDDAPTGWQNADVIVALTATDDTSGVANTYYCVDQANTCTPTTVGISATVSAEGTNYVRYYSVDTAGNDEDVNSATVLLDKTPPATGDNTPADWQTSPFSITLTPSNDGLSPVTTYYTTDGIDPTTASAQGTTIHISTDGEYTIKYFSKDEAGNTESVQTAVNTAKLDTTNPATIDDAPTGWQNADVIVALTATDDTSGVANTYYCVDQANTCTPTTVGISATVSAEGTNYVRYYSVDTAGNDEDVNSATVLLDKTPPATGDNTPADWQTSPFSITLTPSNDGLSPVTTYYTTDGIDPTTASAQGTTIHISTDGEYTIKYFSKDEAGNTESVQTAVNTAKLDTTNPATIDDAPTGWQNADVIVALTATDDTSGVANTYYCVDQANTCTPTTVGISATVSAEGTNYVRYYSVDTAGNDEDVNSATVLLDKTPPATGDNTPADWQTSPFSITLTPSNDGLSPVTTYYTTDGIDSTTASAQGTTIHISTDGEYTIKYFSKDEAGNTESVQTAVNTAKLDTTNPATIDDAPTGWQNADVIVALTATDDTSGVANTYYCVDQANTCTPTTVGISATVSAEGTNYVRYYSVDTAGNDEDVNSATVLLDKTPPATGDNTPADWQTSPFSITLTPSNDGLSPVTTYYTTDGIDPTTASAQGTTIHISTDGEYTIKYFSKDEAGNTESVQTAVNTAKLDTTNPATIDDAPTGWQNADVIVALTATDDTSGVANTYYCVDQANTCTPTTVGISATVSAEGTNYVRYYSVDTAGNDEDVNSATVLLDKTPPATGDNTPADWQTSPFSITLTPSNDGLSPVTTYYTTDGIDPTTASAQGTTIHISTDGEYTIKYFSKDEAGNTESVQTAVNTAKLDTTNPATIDDAPTGWQNADVIVALTATDDTSGVANTYYCVDQANTCTPTTVGISATVSAEGTNYVRYYSVDTAGNDEDVNSATVLLDKTPPATGDNTPADWQTSPFSITLTPSNDGLSPVTTYYTTDGIDSTTASAQGTTIHISTDGEYTIKYFSKDEAGNTESVQTAVNTAKLDTTNPATIDDAPTGWQNADVIVALTATDDTSGVANTYYCVDQANTCTPTTVGISATVSAEGTNYVRYYSVDTAGNDEDVNSATVLLDKTPPATGDNTPADWQTSPFSITLTPSNDGLSPVTTYYTTDGIDPTTASAQGTTIHISTDGEYTIKYFSKDEAGNTESVQTAVNTAKLDTEAPANYSVTIDQSHINESNQTALSFTFTNAEVDATYNYSIDSNNGGTTVIGNGTITTANQQVANIDVRGLNDGTLTLTAYLTDQAENQGSDTDDTVMKDILAPEIINETPTGVVNYTNSTISADFGADVSGVDISGVTVQVTGGSINFDESYFTVTGSGIISNTSEVNLDKGTTYSVAINGLKDIFENATDEKSWTFTISSNASEVDNEVLSPIQFPANGSENVAINTVLSLTFSEAMDKLTLTANNIQLREYNTTTGIDISLAISEGGTKVTIIPDSDLANNTHYYFFVGAGVKDLADNSLSPTWISSNRADHEFTTIAEDTPVTTYDIPLNAGWNLISLPLIPNSTAIVDVLGNATSSMGIVWSYRYDENGDGIWYFYNPTDVANSTLGTMEDGKGYWIFMNNGDNLIGNGTEMPEGGSNPVNYSLSQNDWNLVGFKSTKDMNAGNYINDYTDKTLNNNSILWDYKDRNGNGNGEYSTTPMHSSDNMESGYGYWLLIQQ